MSGEPPPGALPGNPPGPVAQPGGLPVQVDPADVQDTDSAHGDDVGSYTTSLTESVTNYVYESGRRYHAYRKGSYVLPNDEQEKDRLDIMHHLITLRLDNRLHLAPIENSVQRILDLGTGTGIWAIEMGDAYPSAEVSLYRSINGFPTVTLLEEVKLTFVRLMDSGQRFEVPPNVKFEVDDIETEWTYNSPFDFIHSRAMAAVIADWPRLVQQCFQFTKPGGWVEFVDFDMTVYSSDESLSEDNPLRRWNTQVLNGARMIGREPNPGPLLAGLLRDAGFVSVKEEVLRLPIGTWPIDKKLKEVGAFNLIQLLEGLDAFSLALFTRVLGWSKEEVDVLLESVKNAVKTRSTHSQYNMHVVYAQKPE